jgi:hypothetical protein
MYTYYHTGYDRMRQHDLVNPASKEFYRCGLSGKYFAPKSVTVKVDVSQITDGIPINVTCLVYF